MTEGKAYLRKLMNQKRQELTAAEKDQAAAGLAVHLAAFLRLRYGGTPETRRLQIAVYAAIRSELDLTECCKLLRQWQADLYFPAVCRATGGDYLAFGRLPENRSPAEFLRPGAFGVPEPPAESLLSETPRLDLLLIPGLAFDRRGGRLGWGKAYYDRLLAAMKSSSLRVGIGYAFQLLPTLLPCDEQDQNMDVILTPDGWIDADPCFLPEQSGQ
ncbi:MAG: 5-formyltetrahydrofolate cyclo-ligase [Clostridiaceae bacterium]|nr:5-formyltetrahydrofolate cyclo-ligase [Clostridiaceae bacterium]